MYYVRNVAWTQEMGFSGKRREYIYNIPVCVNIETVADALVIAEVAALEYSERNGKGSYDPIVRTERNEDGFTCVHESEERMEFRVTSWLFVIPENQSIFL